jgi:2'-5' RNA ligase
MRLFVAVGVPEAVAADLDGAVAPLRAAWPALRWTGREAWHLTLAFLGEMPDGATSRLVPRLERAAARHPLMSLSLGGSGAFPASPRARVFWTGVRGEQAALSTLAASVAAGARRAGAPGVEENRRYRPHLTLARCREPVDARDLVAGLAGYAGPPWDAGQIHLIRSYLPGGRPQQRPRYETLGSWPLRVPAAGTGGQ